MRKNNIILFIEDNLYCICISSYRNIVRSSKIIKLNHPGENNNDRSLENETKQRKTTTRRTIICLPEGSYHHGHGSYQRHINHKLVAKAVASIAGDFFSTSPSNIWFDYYKTKPNKSCKTKEEKTKPWQRKQPKQASIDYLWIATPEDRLRPFNNIYRQLESQKTKLSIAPILLANALLVLTSKLQSPVNTTWIIPFKKRIYLLVFENNMLQNFSALPTEQLIVRTNSINLDRLYELVKIHAQNNNILHGGDKFCASILGRPAWFFAKAYTDTFTIKEKLYNHLMKISFRGNIPHIDNNFQKVYISLIMLGASVSH